MRQRTNPGVREENFIAGDRELTLAKFLVREQFGQCHAAKLMGKGPARKVELKPVGDGGDLVEITRIELNDLVAR